ncbi:glucosaminidase domain-containing protein [Brevibacillus laterosporus]|uniref:N-acetylmuramoyl-L-alanine amidase n=1 Tax=Brevibacillus laterosporus TaxID=1465 RepID=A0AAP3DK36_BRELA|nr:glucosaminidase domain-containing protein [Brevibacillus laterosporus]MCR8982580.1 N-acetylmuramoyl-L-alanine amidase [Brevibacillus laterosporus]MCZ0809736.1 N-acetylmuramoyl-L-alanine amidase [Brevibacillus laterosporus]MCZ0828330.1 N-acetylmuramoyl-L-alanine amidase [Brevibacillus laterosporus]MCZ0851396.1 N-acetylmuramoyl-L-alanine amidase [Brevibacillus laterosporus]
MRPQDFIDKLAPIAIKEMQRTGIPASLTIAQGILESGWGASELAVNANNWFGIKGAGPEGSYERDSPEEENGKKIMRRSPFRKYHDWADSVRDHSEFLLRPRYAKIINADWRTACHEIEKAGYATDSQYDEKLIKRIEEYQLYKYDQGVDRVARPILIIDPGHGGTDSGAVGNGMREKDITLQISLYQFNRFKELGLPVAITRTADTTLKPTQRTGAVKQSGAEYCISNHINAGGGEGVEAIHSIHATDKLAKALVQSVVDCGQKFRKVYSRLGNGGTDYYFMHRETGTVDTTIMEYGFIDNPNDAALLKANWEMYAEAVVKAFCGYVGHLYKPKGGVASMSDLDKSLEVLVKAGIIKTPEYWQNNAIKGGTVLGDYAATLIINMAKKLGSHLV